MRERQIKLEPRAVREPCIYETFAPYFRTEVEGGQQLDITVHGLEDAERVIINCLPWSEYTLRPDANARYNIMAKYADALVLSVDNPGVGLHNSRLTRYQRRMLREGSLEPFAAMQHEALRKVAEKTGINLARASIVGYSLGTVMAANLAPLLDPRHVTLIEPVGDATVKPYSELTHSFLHDATRDAQYKEENPRWFKELQTNLPPQKLPLYDYLHMMAHGGNFTSYEKLENIDTMLVRGCESTVATEQHVAQLSERIHDSDVLTLVGENHSMLNSIGRIAALFAKLRECNRI